MHKITIGFNNQPATIEEAVAAAIAGTLAAKKIWMEGKKISPQPSGRA